MASTSSFSREDALESIREKGVCYIEDAEVGKEILEFYQKGLPTKTVYGLDFCAQNTLEKPDIRAIVELTIDRPRWGLLKIYSDIFPSDLAYFFHNRTTLQIPTLLVQLWSPGSRVIFYEGAHLQFLDAKESKDWGLLTLPRERMRRDGISEAEPEMMAGRLAISDSRTGFTILKGYVINIGFVTEDEIHFWAKMELPDSEALRNKIEDLKCRRIETNFKFVK